MATKHGVTGNAVIHQGSDDAIGGAYNSPSRIDRELSHQAESPQTWEDKISF